MKIVINKKFILAAMLMACTLQSEEQSSTLADEMVLHSEEIALEPGAVMFTPPKGWRAAAPNALPSNVLIMVVGKGQHEYPPNINLGTDHHKGSMKDFLKIVKAINDADGAQWNDLGKIKTKAGEGSLSQVDIKTEWGDVRMMHVMIQRGETIYILTASALKNEYSRFYKDFFDSMRSLNINPEAVDMVKNPRKRQKLEQAIAKLKNQWKQNYNMLFNDTQFQKLVWIPFEQMLEADFNEMGPKWHNHVLDKLKRELNG